MLSQDQRARAYDAVDYARLVRERNRRRSRKGEALRERALREALARVKRAMKPVRSEIHKTQFQPPTPYRHMLLGLSADLQTERRKLWKMLQPSKAPDRVQKRLTDYLKG